MSASFHPVSKKRRSSLQRTDHVKSPTFHPASEGKSLPAMIGPCLDMPLHRGGGLAAGTQLHNGTGTVEVWLNASLSLPLVAPFLGRLPFSRTAPSPGSGPREGFAIPSGRVCLECIAFLHTSRLAQTPLHLCGTNSEVFCIPLKQLTYTRCDQLGSLP